MIEDLISAGQIRPDGNDIYVVEYAQGHKTLNAGDRVVMREDASFNNLFVRISDFTLHTLQSGDDYVLVSKEADAA